MIDEHQERDTTPPPAPMTVHDLSEQVALGFDAIHLEITEMHAKLDRIILAAPGKVLHELNNKIVSVPELIDLVRGYVNEVVATKDEQRRTARLQSETALRLDLLESKLHTNGDAEGD